MEALYGLGTKVEGLFGLGELGVGFETIFSLASLAAGSEPYTPKPLNL